MSVRGAGLCKGSGDEYLLDNHVYSNDGLTVFGLHEEPAAYGTLAGKWLDVLTGDVS